MRSIERGRAHESLDAMIASVARVYGFTMPPTVVPRKALDDVAVDERAAALITTVADGIVVPAPLAAGVTGPVGGSTLAAQAWGFTKQGGGGTIAFAIASGRHAIAQAFVVKAALASAEAAGLSALSVLVSSVGDHESQHRYMRELNNFFRKHMKELPEDVRAAATKSPTDALRLLTLSAHALTETLPRTVDYLSEASRKVMLETLTLFESLKIPYELAPRLPTEQPMTGERARGSQHHFELIFAIEGTDEDGVRVRIASGGRFESTTHGPGRVAITGMAMSVAEALDARDMRATRTPTCFVVHVGEAAKLKAFMLLDSLWHAHVALDQAVLATSIQDQMHRAQVSGAKYLAIIGQREALDGTVILRTVATQLQETLPLPAFLARMARIRA